jgi:hypothetical protein
MMEKKQKTFYIQHLAQKAFATLSVVSRVAADRHRVPIL